MKKGVLFCFIPKRKILKKKLTFATLKTWVSYPHLYNKNVPQYPALLKSGGVCLTNLKVPPNVYHSLPINSDQDLISCFTVVTQCLLS